MRLLLANPRGFCAGVDRAIEIVDRALEIFGAPVYVRHEVVHNRFVVDGLRAKGAIFVEELEEVPEQAVLVFSAHGVPRSVQEQAKQGSRRIFDATCPLVTKVHLEVARHARVGREVVLIGHAGHPEVEGTLGQYDGAQGGAIYLVETAEDVACLKVSNSEELAYVTQTTLSVDDAANVVEALRRRYPSIQGPKKDDICYATQNRQDAVKELASRSDVVLVVGSPNSSNSNRLREVAERLGTSAYLVDSANDLRREWFQGRERVGITAGASAPEVLVRQVIDRLQIWGAGPVENASGREEGMYFPIPKELA